MERQTLEGLSVEDTVGEGGWRELMETARHVCKPEDSGLRYPSTGDPTAVLWAIHYTKQRADVQRENGNVGTCLREVLQVKRTGLGE